MKKTFQSSDLLFSLQNSGSFNTDKYLWEVGDFLLPLGAG